MPTLICGCVDTPTKLGRPTFVAKLEDKGNEEEKAAQKKTRVCTTCHVSEQKTRLPYVQENCEDVSFPYNMLTMTFHHLQNEERILNIRVSTKKPRKMDAERNISTNKMHQTRNVQTSLRL